MAVCTRSVMAPGAGWSGTRPRIRGSGCGSLPALRRPVLVLADRASSIAPIGVQLVKYVLHPLSNAGWPTRGARCPHRDRRGFGAGSPPWRWPPDRSPQRNRSHRCQQDNSQRNVRRHQVLHNALPPLWTAVAAVLPCRLDRSARRLRRYGQRRRTASAQQMNLHRPRTPCGPLRLVAPVRPVVHGPCPRPRLFAPGPEVFAY
jgi:hypothetical protein